MSRESDFRYRSIYLIHNSELSVNLDTTDWFQQAWQPVHMNAGCWSGFAATLPYMDVGRVLRLGTTASAVARRSRKSAFVKGKWQHPLSNEDTVSGMHYVSYLRIAYFDGELWLVRQLYQPFTAPDADNAELAWIRSIDDAKRRFNQLP